MEADKVKQIEPKINRKKEILKRGKQKLVKQNS